MKETALRFVLCRLGLLQCYHIRAVNLADKHRLSLFNFDLPTDKCIELDNQYLPQPFKGLPLLFKAHCAGIPVRRDGYYQVLRLKAPVARK